MTENEKRQLFIGLYENTCRAILDIESECLRFNATLSTRERDVLRTASDFKDAIWEMLIHDINTKDPYND